MTHKITRLSELREVSVSAIDPDTWFEGNLSGGFTGLFYRGDGMLINFNQDGSVRVFRGGIVGDISDYMPVDVEIHYKTKKE